MTSPVNRTSSENVMSQSGHSNMSAVHLFPHHRDLSHQTDYFDFVLYQVCAPALFGVISLIGVIGNTLVVYVILSKDRMRTVTNLLLLNLAIADLAFVFVIPPFTAYQLATDSWPFGEVACRFMHYLVNVTAYVTVYTIVLISLIRYLTVVHGQRTAELRTPLKTILYMIGLWIIMLLLNIPILGSYELKYYDLSDLHGVAMWPDCDIVDQTRGQAIYSTFFAFAYMLPLSTVALLYLGILRHVSRARTRRLTSFSRSTGEDGGRSSGSSIQSRPSQYNSARRHRQLGRLLVFVILLFATLWLPIHVHLLFAYFSDLPQSRAYEAVSVVWNALAYINSCVNPFVYNCTSKEFRDAFHRVMSSRRHPSGGQLRVVEGPDTRSDCLSCVRGRLLWKQPQLTYSTTYDRMNIPTVCNGSHADVTVEPHNAMRGTGGAQGNDRSRYVDNDNDIQDDKC